MDRPRRRRVGMTREQRILVVLLIGLGVSLLLFGSLVAVPYVRSRLWTWTAPGGDAIRQPGGEAGQGDSGVPDAASPTACCGESDLAGEEEPDRASPFEEVVEDPPSEPAPPTRLMIPKLGIDASIVPVQWSPRWVSGRQVGVWDVPEGGAVGWHEGSAPLGQVGNTVLNGHNTTGGEVFRDLYTMEARDVLTIYSELKPYTYVVSETLVLPEAGQSWDLRLWNASLLEQTPDERVTLVTCHPYGSLRNRLIVIAVPTAAEPDPE
jgi:LPXTG-site transpeptidase (sortase) family protein